MKSVFKKVVGVLGGATVGKLFWDQTEELAQEYEEYNAQLAESIARVRENFDALQANCDRIAARTVGAALQKRIREGNWRRSLRSKISIRISCFRRYYKRKEFLKFQVLCLDNQEE